MRISDWSSDVCSSDLRLRQFQLDRDPDGGDRRTRPISAPDEREAGPQGAARRQPVEPDVGGARGADAVLHRAARGAGLYRAGTDGDPRPLTPPLLVNGGARSASIVFAHRPGLP